MIEEELDYLWEWSRGDLQIFHKAILIVDSYKESER